MAKRSVKILHECNAEGVVAQELPPNAINAKWIWKCSVCKQKWAMTQLNNGHITGHRIGLTRHLWVKRKV